MLIRFTVCSLCILTYCNFSYFPLWFRGRDFGSECISSWSLLIIHFCVQQKDFWTSLKIKCRTSFFSYYVDLVSFRINTNSMQTLLGKL